MWGPMAGVADSLYGTIERTVEGLGYELVDVERLGGGLLRVTLDRASGIGLEDCERVSRQLTHLLAVEGVDYQRLEVSSPGVDRPLKRVRDFARFVGSEINVQLYAPLPAPAGRKRLRGRLLGVSGGAGSERLRLELAPDEGGQPGPSAARRRGKASRVIKPGALRPVVEFAYADVDKARLVPELDFRGAAAAAHGGSKE
jgi:ribosome maturation factor RimP